MARTLDELLIEATPQRVRAAAIVDGGLVDFHAAPRRRVGATGSIYLGRVSRRASAMGAAFVDIGLARPAVLELVGAALPQGATIVVQIVEEGRDDKGARVTRRVGLPGRLVVLLPDGKGVAVSKRFAGANRRTIKEEASRALGQGLGAIVRERATRARPGAIADELALLVSRWTQIAELRARSSVPSCLVDTGDGLAEALDEFAAADPRRIIANDRAAAHALVALAEERYPELTQRIEAAREGEALFDRYDVASVLAAAEDKLIPLPSGGRIIIEPTAALVAIDVDSGAAATSAGGAVAVNIEAAAALALQVRLRDLCGLIAIDFIRMPRQTERMRVLNALTAAAAPDRRAPRILGFTGAGLVEMIRSRSRQGAG